MGLDVRVMVSVRGKFKNRKSYSIVKIKSILSLNRKLTFLIF